MLERKYMFAKLTENIYFQKIYEYFLTHYILQIMHVAQLFELYKKILTIYLRIFIRL